MKFNIVAKPLNELLTGEITTVCGGIPFLGDGGSPTLASFSGAYSVAIDNPGNIFFANYDTYRIRRIDSATGLISTVVGSGNLGFSEDGTSAIAAAIGAVDAIAIDASGNLLFADNNQIRRVDAVTGKIETIIGSGEYGSSGDGGPAIAAALNGPTTLAVDRQGTVYFTDFNRTIRSVNANSNIIETFAGNGGESVTGDGGLAIRAGLGSVDGLWVDGGGNVFVAGSHRVRRVDSATRHIDTIVGSGSAGSSGDNGPARFAAIDGPSGLATDSSGNLYVVDSTANVVRRIDSETGIITTIAGTGQCGRGAEGIPATQFGLCIPGPIAITSVGDILLADEGSFLRSVSGVDGTIRTIAGRSSTLDVGDGDSANVADVSAYSIAIDADDNLYLGDGMNWRVRRLDPSRTSISSVVGIGEEGDSGDGGPALQARITHPIALAFGPDGDLYIADSRSSVVRRLDLNSGIITRVAGTGLSGSDGDGGPALSASFILIRGLAVNGSGDVFVSDTSSSTVREVEASTGTIRPYAGTGTIGHSGDGGPAIHATLSRPAGLAIDPLGNLLIADRGTGVRTVIAATGIIETVSNLSAYDVAFDGAGNLFVATTTSIFRLDATTGVTTLVAGDGSSSSYSGDGGPARQAGFTLIFKIAIDHKGDVYVADDFSGLRVVKGVAVPLASQKR